MGRLNADNAITVQLSKGCVKLNNSGVKRVFSAHLSAYQIFKIRQKAAT